METSWTQVGIACVALGAAWYFLSHHHHHHHNDDNDDDDNNTTNNSSSIAGSNAESDDVLSSGTITLDDSDFGNTAGLSSEVKRDFARYFSTHRVVFTHSVAAALALGNIQKTGCLSPMVSRVDNVAFDAATNDATVRDFQEQIATHFLPGAAAENGSEKSEQEQEQQQQQRGDAGRVDDGVVTEQLLTLLVRCITVNAGFKVAMEELKFPSFLQPTFLVTTQWDQCHVITYGFVGPNKFGPPGTGELTDTVVKITSPDLLRAKTGEPLTFQYKTYPTTQGDAVSELYHDYEKTGMTMGVQPLRSD